MSARNRPQPRSVLIVAMADSVHTARWVAQLPVAEWDVHVFSSTPSGATHPALQGVTVHHLCRSGGNPRVLERGVPVPHRRVAPLGEEALDATFPSLRPRLLARLIRRLRPDVIHSLEIQHAGYLTCRARELTTTRFPPWLVTNWGNDIYHFGKDPAHVDRIREVLAACDAYSCECERDVRLAKEMGFRGRVFPPSPNTGGFDLERIARLRSGPTSARRLIMLKGYHGWAGRALVALRALESIQAELRGYRLCVYSASPEVARVATRIAALAGMTIEVIDQGDRVAHEDMLRRHGQARTSIGVSVTDGVSTSFLEAMVMGSFPIQSWTSCANEWVVDGETGILVPPEDHEEVARAILRALREDALVDRAAEKNWDTARARLDGARLALEAREIYFRMVSGN